MLNNGTSDQELRLLIINQVTYYILLPLSRDQNEFSAFFCNSLKVIETHAEPPPGKAGRLHALEGLVGQHLRAWVAYSKSDCSIHFWRTRSGVEVDFVVYGSEGLFAVEVKNSARINPQDLRPLKAFKQDYPESKVYLLYRGKDRLLKGDVLCLPCTDFLMQLRPGQWFDT